MKQRVIIVCNALDDVTRHHRGITTDSPAASRKIFMLCEALRMAGVKPFVLSLGRGRAGGNTNFFSASAHRVNGVAVLYAPFARLRIFSESLSFLAPVILLYRLCAKQQCSVIFYNRLVAYLPTLLSSHVLGNRNFLDLEDGEVQGKGGLIGLRLARVVQSIFDKLCRDGALLACRALHRFTSVRPTLCYYGTAPQHTGAPRFNSQSVSVLLGGTLNADTGAELLIAAISKMRSDGALWASNVTFHITGSGSSLKALDELAMRPGHPALVVHGRTTNAQYTQVLRSCDIGLALKLNGGALADTTFPSKVIEYAAAEMLVLTTDISDVRLLLGEGALYLMQDSPDDLVALLELAVRDKVEMQRIARLGCQRVQSQCAPSAAGQMVADFLAGAN